MDASASKEKPNERLQEMRIIAEKMATDPEAFKERVRSLSGDELNALSSIFQTEKKEKLTEEVKTAIRARLDVLDAESTTESLDALMKRLPEVKKVLEPQLSNKERLHNDMEAASSMATEAVGGVYQRFQTSFIKPLGERTKNIFLVGPLMGSIADLSPDHIKNIVARKWYQFLSTAEFFGGTDSKGVLGKMFNGIAENARQKLLVLDVRDVIDEYKLEKRTGENISFDTNMTREQWKKMKDLLTKNPNVAGTNAANAIDQQRKAGIPAIKITFVDLLKTDAELAEQSKNAASEKLKNDILALDAWKNAGVKTVQLKADEVSMSRDTLTIDQTELDERGNAKPDSRAEALLNARKDLTKAENVTISKESDDHVTINWKSQTVTLSRKTNLEMAIINELAGSPRPDRFSMLDIGSHDNISPDQAELVLRDGANVLLVENNPSVIDAVLNRKLTDKTENPPAKYRLESGDFVHVAPPMPARAS